MTSANPHSTRNSGHLISVAFATLLAIYMPGIVRADDPASPSTGTWAFEHPDDTFKPDAILDLRYLNERQAGQAGFVKLSEDKNSFVYGDGKPLRFWAIGSEIYHKTPAEMASHARFLAKIGVNMVRLHTQIAPQADDSKITDADQKEIDGIWHMVAALKKEGIYTTLSPYWANGKPATNWGIDGYTGRTDLWGILFFNETLQKGYKAWVRALYEPKNPYTGIPLAHDPAVAIIQVQNEDGMFFWTIQGMHPEQHKVLNQKFGAWLIKKYGSLDKAKTAWDGATDPGDDFANSIAAVNLQVWQWTQQPAGGAGKRLIDNTHFLADVQYGFYRDIAGFYKKELGCKQLINASNWITGDAIVLNDLERYTNTADDVIAVNKYFGGVHAGANNGWRIDPEDHYTDKPGVLNPRDLPTNLKQPVGHPMLITESTWVSPMAMQNEGPFLMAAYQSLTGVDVFYWFSAGAPQFEMHPHLDFLNVNGQHPLFKWSCAIPEIMDNFPAAALLFRKGYLKQAKPVVHEERPLEDLYERKVPRIAEDASFDPNRYNGDTVANRNIDKGIDPLAFLVGPVEVKYGGDASKTTVSPVLDRLIDRNKNRVTSETRQIQLNYGDGLCTIDAPKAQGATGFLRKAGEIKLSTIALQSGNEQASVLVVPLDDKPLGESGKVLIQIGTPARPTGWAQEPADFPIDDGKNTAHGFKITNTGTMPWLVTNADVTLTIKNPRLKKAKLLNTSGYLARDLPGVKIDKGSLTIKVPGDALYVVLE